MHELFAKNLRYINDMSFGETELDVGAVERMFVNEGDRFTLRIGSIDITDNKLRIGDMSYLSHGKFTPVYDGFDNASDIPVEAAGYRSSCCAIRMCAVRLRFKDSRPERYAAAEPTKETVVMKCSDGDLYGFPVDAGMIAITGSEGMKSLVSFTKEWEKAHSEENFYDGYIAPLLKESSDKLPDFQREGGDFAEISIPDTERKAVLCASGFGDGYYSCYKGIDSEGEVCELVIPFINEDMLEKRDIEYLKVWDGEPLCLVTNHVNEGGKVTYMLREEPFPKLPDSGWRFYGENEDEDYWDDSDNYTFMNLHDVAERQPEIIPLLRSPEESSFILTEDGTFAPDTENR